MSDDFSVPVSGPLDSDGFLRRECPNCEQEFKWFSHQDGDPDAEPVDQYFCPRCGVAANTDAWWTPEQLDHAQGVAAPELDRFVQDAMKSAFKGVKGSTHEPNPNFTLGIDAPQPLTEPDDMVIVGPPCHPNEPLKVPEDALGQVHCLICGRPFAA